MSKIGIVFGSNEGDAKNAAEYIAKNFDSEVIDAKDLTNEFLNSHSKLIFVASTHKVGELQNDFKAKLDLIKATDFSGKTLALVGLGGSVRHPDNFCDGLIEFFPYIEKANLVGQTKVDDQYKFNSSKAIKDGEFVGLILDLKIDDSWKNRADNWISSIKNNF